MSGGGSKPGERRGGRKVGSLNKTTLEKRAKAQRELARDTGAPFEERERGSDALFRLADLCEGAANASRPTLETEIQAGVKANPDGDWQRFHDWVKLAAWCRKAGAEFKEPKMQAIAIAAPPEPEQSVQVIRFRIFEGGREIKMIERRRDAAG